MDIYIQITIIF